MNVYNDYKINSKKQHAFHIPYMFKHFRYYRENNYPKNACTVIPKPFLINSRNEYFCCICWCLWILLIAFCERWCTIRYIWYWGSLSVLSFWWGSELISSTRQWKICWGLIDRYMPSSLIPGKSFWNFYINTYWNLQEHNI